MQLKNPHQRHAHVDVRRTMRASLQTGGVPVELRYRPLTDLESDALFVNDKWDLNSNFSFNIGLPQGVAYACLAASVIKGTGYAGYFLITWDFIDWARRNIAASRPRISFNAVSSSGLRSSGTGSPSFSRRVVDSSVRPSIRSLYASSI